MEEKPLPAGRGAYFEGWYFKHQGEEGGLALIPAVHRARKGTWSASLQVITPWESRMIPYPIQAFSRWGDGVELRLGENWFSKDGVYLAVEEPGFSLKGELQYGPLAVPGEDIMGPFRRVPHMQCVHGILSMGHRVDGAVELNGQTLWFDKGRGYWETDRGRSFPKRYLWTQCAWQERQRVSLMLAIAHIPMGLGSFTGIISEIFYAGESFRLATYRGAKVVRWGESGAEVRQGRLRLAAEVLEHRALPLQAPNGGSMSRTIHESLFATVRYRLWEGEKLLFDHTDPQASFEWSDITQ